ncbi:MAG TPA: hypothetical protein VGB99_06320 [Acidobacteriota bacterium]
MSRVEKILLHSSTALVTLTGAALFTMKYLMTSSDPFSVIHHPLQPWALRLHLVVAPALLFVLGMIYRGHVAAKLKNGYREGRRSGQSLIWTLLPMTFSGYLIQVAVEETTRTLAVLVHIATSLGFALAYLLHGWIAWRSKRHLLRAERHETLAGRRVA